MTRGTKLQQQQDSTHNKNHHAHTPNHDMEEELLKQGWTNTTDPHLLKWLKEADGGGRVFQPSLRPYNVTDHNYGHFKDFGVFKFYEKHITKLLSSKVSGFFVEAGALDGYILSNTLILERFRAWSGLLVEPRPDMFQQLLQKQRKAFAARFCLAEKPYLYKTKFWLSPDFVKDNIAFGAVGSRVYDKVQAAERESGSLVNVLCIPVASLLIALDVTYVDLFVVDVEGSEWGVLDNFPFHQITVDMLAVERKDKGQEDRKAFIKMVRSKGFGLLDSLKEDYIFIRKSAEFLVLEDDP
ncbi:hypothetical protein Pcinc_032747 [Petrolisthes cinctipes]|uniref:Methyltransferase FkbM domain-containing protein n=1 Tax=Petrolisthes cinctipes TaxID=88211 RepID=A0AAE1ETM2_PETCI|nr:hypothetical protein Pcinc_032747 [Petrolisthes cinctipes]